METTVKTKLDELYSLRENYSVIGITGRTGSGCSDVAKILASRFYKLRIKPPSEKPKSIQERKYEIVYNFNAVNWKRYRVIEYKNVLIFLLSNGLTDIDFRSHLKNYYRFSNNVSFDLDKIQKVHETIIRIFNENPKTVDQIKSFSDFNGITSHDDLLRFAKFYWGDFEQFAKKIDRALAYFGIAERIKLLHHTASNLRRAGNAFDTSETDFKNVYYIAEFINKIIKGTRLLDNKKCHVVIDSLRNSLEINFFKERYSAFYLVAVKSDERKLRMLKSYQDNENLVNRILELDNTEYRCKDFENGRFFAPDVQNCIQKADYHIITNSRKLSKIDFISLEQQLMKLQGLIQQPGLITPSTIERCMQFAFNAKLSSGCISRQVGAVITDNEFSVKSIGWNDVPRGAVPCVARNIKEIKHENSFGFSSFEKGLGLKESSDVSFNANPDHAEIDQESKSFNKFLKENFNELRLSDTSLGGINCPYCFKTVYNTFKGEKNQVHTRSLHAEENAMLQISKYGGQPLKDGILFTTASPCELCSKKAYQLGIKKIYYIDPYPGISRSHILRQGVKPVSTDNMTTDPELHMFYGAIGRGFVKLYEPFLSQKDEIGILTDFELKTPVKEEVKQIKKILEKRLKNDPKLNEFFKDEQTVIDRILTLVEKGNNLLIPVNETDIMQKDEKIDV